MLFIILVSPLSACLHALVLVSPTKNPGLETRFNKLMCWVVWAYCRKKRKWLQNYFGEKKPFTHSWCSDCPWKWILNCSLLPPPTETHTHTHTDSLNPHFLFVHEPFLHPFHLVPYLPLLYLPPCPPSAMQQLFIDSNDQWERVLWESFHPGVQGTQANQQQSSQTELSLYSAVSLGWPQNELEPAHRVCFLDGVPAKNRRDALGAPLEQKSMSQTAEVSLWITLTEDSLLINWPHKLC